VANRLTMATIQAILALYRSGHSNREIARLLGVHRETVAGYLRAAEIQNRPNAPTGSPDESTVPGEVKTAIASGPPSQRERFRDARHHSRHIQRPIAPRVFLTLLPPHRLRGLRGR
jgi:hypothetical protein